MALIFERIQTDGIAQLSYLVGDDSEIFLSHEGGARYGFDHEKVADGDTFKIGSTLITVMHTPGEALGRPVGVAIDREGALLVADDVGNIVWRVAPR